ncbi:hypothetical protein M9458_053885 [Cirrhinus mrigala]|uniref:Uncharacterized protein n=1 Tax=Cirrhinus mrigala TaxID=683832 RepID=A0ABD0MKZ9_CIRMR
MEQDLTEDIYVEWDLIDFYGDVDEDKSPLLPPSSELSACHELSACLNFPATLPLLSPSIVPAASVPPPLSPGSPSAHPQPTICAVGSPRFCQSPSASWLEDPSSPPPASESTGLPHPSSSTLVARRPAIASGLHSSSCVLSLHPTGFIGLLPPSGSASDLCRSGSAMELRISASVARALGSALALRILSVSQDHRLSVSASGSTTTCSASNGRPPRVVSPSSTMAPPSVSPTVDHHLGCGLGFAWLLLLWVPSVSSLTPPSI